MRVECSMDEVNANDPQGFLLAHDLIVQHANVNVDLRRIRSRLGLEAYPEPAMAFLFTCRDGIGEDKKGRRCSALFQKPFQKEVVLVFEHGLEPAAADVPVRSGRRWRR